MRAPWKRAAILAIATCGFSSLTFMNGCKTDLEKSDAAVSADLDKATEALAKDGPDSAASAMQTLQKTTTIKNDSPESQIESNLLMSQAETDAADEIINGRMGEPGIIQRQVTIADLISQIATIGAQIDAQNAYISGFKALEPTGGHKAIEQLTSAAQKGDNGTWIPGTAPLPSLDALKQKEQDLQKQIADLNQQKTDLQNKRTQALDQAGKFGQQADSTTSKESVGFFIQAANQRKEAADAEAKIQQIDGQLQLLQQDLSLAQLQEKAIGDVVAGLGDASQQLDNGWKSVQLRIDEATGLSKSLLDGTGAPDASGAAAAAPTPASPVSGGSPTTAPSGDQSPRNIGALAAELDKQVKEIQSLRGKAVDLLSSASKHIDAARSIAGTFTTSLMNRTKGPDANKLPERHAWQTLLSIYAPAGFDLHQAGIQSRLARLYADQYAELSQRNRLAAALAPALKQSGLPAPQSLAGALPAPEQLPEDVTRRLQGVQGDLRSDQPKYEQGASDLAALAAQQNSPAAQQAIAATQTEFAFHWASSLLKNVVDNAGQGDLASLLQNIAHAALMANDYAAGQFAILQGKQQEGDALMKSALAERQTLVDNNGRNLLPAVLPAELAFPVQAVTPAPAGPTTAPAAPAVTPSVVFPGSTTPPATSPATAPGPEGTPPATTSPAGDTTPPAATPPAATPPPEGTTPPATPPGTTPPPAPGTTPPAEGTTPPATPPATTPPAEGTTPPPATPPATPPPAEGTTPPATPPAPAPAEK